MIPQRDQDDIEANPLTVIPQIGDCLRRGWLNLFLGAGVSKPFGLPGWPELVHGITSGSSEALTLEELKTKSDKELSRLVDPFDDGSQAYIQRVHKALYSGVPGDLMSRMTTSPLLLAVAALLTGKVRGRIEKVFTFNYDNFIEEYLSLLGYEVCVRKNPDDLSTRADIEINHVHGYLPRLEENQGKVPELILSSQSYRNRRTEIAEGWSLTIGESLMSKSALILGMSGNDDSILDVFKVAQKKIVRYANHVRHEKKLGYWLVSKNHYVQNKRYILDTGMCPVPVSKDELPEFLLRICQMAMRPQDETAWKLPLHTVKVDAQNNSSISS